MLLSIVSTLDRDLQLTVIVVPRSARVTSAASTSMPAMGTWRRRRINISVGLPVGDRPSGYVSSDLPFFLMHRVLCRWSARSSTGMRIVRLRARFHSTAGATRIVLLVGNLNISRLGLLRSSVASGWWRRLCRCFTLCRARCS